jgi:hypothetical protein
MKKLLLLISLLFAGCACPEIDSLKSLNETILPEYEAYVEKDENLTEAGKKIRKLRLKTFRRLIDALDR